MKLRAIMLAACLAACGPFGGQQADAPPQPGEAADPAALNIEIGRYGVMLDQVTEQTRERPAASEANVEEPRELARRLRETVWEYNLERSRLCAKGLHTEVSCGPSYAPVWIAEADTAAPSVEDLQIRSVAVGTEVMRLWNAVCDDARTRVQDEQERRHVCAIE